eukprot:1202954-Pyramimonas_sp.AAC.1
MTPKTGGRMGDSNEPELFMESFYPIVSARQRELGTIIGDSLSCKGPLHDRWDDLAFGGFIDDLIR